MRVENNSNQYPVNNMIDNASRHNNQNDRGVVESLVDTGVSMEISQRGLALAGEMEPFLDTYETTCTLLKGTGHIGSEKMMNGDFADILAENYQNELQRLKENYSGKEYDRQLAVLDKAYEEAAKSVSRGYAKQLKMLAGDIVIKPQTGISYSTEDSIVDIGKNRFSTIFGATTESKYGYAAQLDSVSRDYAAAMFNHDYATAAGIDVISAMDEKYQSIKAEIEEKYSGEEKDARLSELDDNYKFILDSNVISPTDLAIKNESAINKLRSAFAKAYDNAQNTKSSQFIETAYGSLANWSGVCEEIDAQLKSYKELFEQFKEALYSSQSKSGGKEYVGSLLKSINSGLAGVKDQNDTLEKGVNGSGSQRAKELWGLIEKKTQAYFSNNNLYKSDEEKYQAFLKDTAHISAIDNRLDEILKEILGEE